MIVVTGASGFIGSNLVREWNRRGRMDVLAVDDYPWLRGSCRVTPERTGVRYGEQMAVTGFLDMDGSPYRLKLYWLTYSA